MALAGLSLDAPPGAVGQKLPALLIVLEIGHHDLVEHLGVNRGGEDGDMLTRRWRLRGIQSAEEM